MRSHLFAIVSVVFAVGALPATAQFESRDDPVFGPDSITLDSVTGLEWLDVPLSVSRSYDDVVGVDGSDELAPGGDFAGFRHATVADLANLFVNAGIADNVFDDPSNFVPVRDLIAFVGATLTLASPNRAIVQGITSDSTMAGSRDVGNLSVNFDDKTGSADSFNQLIPDGGASSIRGHWLIRPAPDRVDTAGLVFAHDFETINGDTILALVGPDAIKSSNVVANASDPLSFSTQHLRAPPDQLVAGVATQTRLDTPSSELAFSLFYNDRGDPPGPARLLSSFNGTGLPIDELVFDVDAAGTLRLIVWRTAVMSTSNIPVQSAQWQHVGFVFDNGSVTFYLNGAPLGNPVDFSTALEVFTQALDWALIEDAGPNGPTTEFFQSGDYDEAALFTRALSDTEMNILATEGLAVAVPEPGASALACAALASLAALGIRRVRPERNRA